MRAKCYLFRTERSYISWNRLPYEKPGGICGIWGIEILIFRRQDLSISVICNRYCLNPNSQSKIQNGIALSFTFTLTPKAISHTLIITPLFSPPKRYGCHPGVLYLSNTTTARHNQHITDDIVKIRAGSCLL